MIEIKIDKGNIEKIQGAGTPDQLLAEVTMAVCKIIGRMGNNELKRNQYDKFIKMLTDEEGPAYKEMFPEENESRNKTEAFIKSIFRGK